MKVTIIQMTNFGSYRSLKLNLADQGLTLIHGLTGSGKSTLMDAVLWTVFGTTAKDGAADDVRSWNAEEPTTGTVVISHGSEILTITRIRGQGKNDLYYQIGVGGAHELSQSTRGKDIPETQKLIESRLGFNAALYQTAAYYHELSPSASFFQSTAKHRREIFERIVNLSLPTRLTERLSNRNSELRKDIDASKIKTARISGRIEQLELSIKAGIKQHDLFLQNAASDKRDQKERKRVFEEKKDKKIKDIEEELSSLQSADLNSSPRVCKTCGARSAEAASCQGRISYLKDSLDWQKRQEFQEKLVPAKNPHEETISTNKKLLTEELNKIEEITSYESSLESAVYDIKKLQGLTVELRAELMRRAVKSIQDSTNDYLSKYFDGAFRVEFTSGGDNIGVNVTKDGNACVYKQLSKGQRQILKLCFAVSVMFASANNSGVNFDNLFFDEALDGLDSSFKIKAYDLFQELSTRHGSVYVIEHSTDFKSLFSASIEVAENGGYSEIV